MPSTFLEKKNVFFIYNTCSKKYLDACSLFFFLLFSHTPFHFCRLFQLGCLVAGADVNVSMDEYMIGGLADLAVQKSQTVVQAHAVQCIASLTMISDDGPHETKAALEIILGHVMS